MGEFEELVLLTIGVLKEEAYGVSIKSDIRNRSGRNPSIGALHSALTRLEKKGFVTTHMEGATQNRRGRRKRFYILSNMGIETLRGVYEMRKEMVQLIPNLFMS